MLDWTTGWIAMKFATYIQGPSQVGDPLTFPVVPPADQSFNVFREIFQHLQDGICIDIHPRLWLYLDFSSSTQGFPGQSKSKSLWTLSSVTFFHLSAQHSIGVHTNCVSRTTHVLQLGLAYK